jgi:hypothetical protein
MRRTVEDEKMDSSTRIEGGSPLANVESGSPGLSRAEWLRKVGAGLAGAAGAAIAVGIAGSEVVKANDDDPLLLGHSGNPLDPFPNPNLAEHATQVQYDGAGPPPGVVFLAQADNTYTPSQAGFPAAVAGWTSINPDIPNGVYGYTERPDGSGAVGAAAGPNGRGVLGECFDPNGLGGAFIGPNRAPLNLRPENLSVPPATGQPGDLYVTINVDDLAELWFHTKRNGWRRVVVI